MKKVRTRFAPSPTGPFHVGSARTALFNYLFTRKSGGVFVLRIEDTDKERSNSKYEEDIIRSLEWLGIDWDEGVEKGKYGPYRQSKRGEVYKKYLKQLLEEGKAYRCYCSAKDLEKEREEQRKRGEAPRYSGKCAQLKKEKEGDFVVRFRLPQKEEIHFKDLIRKEVSFKVEDIGDFVIGKSDFSPLYNFAVVVDDHEMQITHVIRGEDHISNTPRQIVLQEALDFHTPYYAHLPLILGPDKSKLSKRHAAVSMYEYREKGYLPEAMINFLSFLGWNPGGEREIYSLEEIIKEFDIERCKKGGAVFNIKKLDSINGEYIRSKDSEELAKMCIPFLVNSGLLYVEWEEEQFVPAYGGKELTSSLFDKDGKEVKMEKISQVVSICKERMRNLAEITELADYFFIEVEYDKELLQWKDMSTEEIHSSLEKGIEAISRIENWELSEIEEVLTKEAGENKGPFLWPFRVALSGKKASAGPFEIAWVLGREETLKRLKKAKNKL